MFKRIALILLVLSTISFAQLKKVSLQLMWHDQFEFAGFYMAKEKGFFKEVGLDVTFKKFSIDTNVTNEVINQRADFGLGSSSLLLDVANGKEILLLSTIFQSSPLILLGIKSPEIKSLKDISNKRVMITKDQERFATLNTMLKSQSINPKSLEYLKHSFDVEDLINKKTDFMLAYTTNEPYLLRKKGYEPLIFHPKDYGFDFYEELVFTSKVFADKNPIIVKNFNAAMLKGWIYAFENIKQSAQLIHKKYNPLNKSLESLIYEGTEMKKLSFTKDGKLGVIDKDKLKLIEQSYRIMGLLKKPIDIDELLLELPSNNDLTKKEITFLKEKRFINMCIDPDWLPFEKLSKGKHIGMSADYIKILQKEINIPIRVIKSKNWSQSLAFGRDRFCDIFSLVMETPQRLKYLDFTKSYLETPLVIATNNQALFISNLKQIKDKKLGMIRDYAYAEILKKKYKHMKFTDVANLKDGLKRVDEGELFGFIGTLAAVGYQIQRNYIGQLKIAGKFDEKWELGIGTRNDMPILNSIFNKAISKISEEQHQTILNNWISVNYQEGVQYKTIWRYFIIALALTMLFVLLYRQYLLKDLNKKLNKKVKEEIEKNSKQHALLSQQTKMAAMGEMLANIAHQWRQPLSLISTASTGLKLQKEIGKLSDENLNKSLDSINDSAQYLSKTIDDFRNFFSKDKTKSFMKIEKVIEQSLNIISAQFVSQEIIIEKDIQEVELVIFNNELIQTIINILNNSKDALLNVSHKRVIFIKAYKNDDSLVLEIKDTAGGIKEELLSRIFEPYFTTKHKYQGTGIGLYMSEQIITKHLKGSVAVENESFTYKAQNYTGAKFLIKIPIILE